MIASLLLVLALVSRPVSIFAIHITCAPTFKSNSSSAIILLTRKLYSCSSCISSPAAAALAIPLAIFFGFHLLFVGASNSLCCARVRLYVFPTTPVNFAISEALIKSASFRRGKRIVGLKVAGRGLLRCCIKHSKEDLYNLPTRT